MFKYINIILKTLHHFAYIKHFALGEIMFTDTIQPCAQWTYNGPVVKNPVLISPIYLFNILNVKYWCMFCSEECSLTICFFFRLTGVSKQLTEAPLDLDKQYVNNHGVSYIFAMETDTLVSFETHNFYFIMDSPSHVYIYFKTLLTT